MTSPPVDAPSIQGLRIPTPRGALRAVRYGRAGDPAVVACHAIGEERKGCVRVLHEVGCALTLDGRSLLAFDYAGTGESPGAFDTVRWEGLVEDAVAAFAFAAEASGRPPTLLGIRLGSRIGLEAAAKARIPPDGAIHWAPLLEGAPWLRELVRRSRFRGTGGPVPAGMSGRDIDGYCFAPALSAAIESATGAPPAPAGPQAVLQIGPGEALTPATRRTAEALGAGDRVRALRMQPFWLESGVPEAGPVVEATRALLRSIESGDRAS